MSDAPTTRVTRVSLPLGAASQKKIIPSPRTDIDMERQLLYAKVRFHVSRKAMLFDAEGRNDAGLDPTTIRNNQRAMLIQLVLEARRFQKGHLAKYGMDIDDPESEGACRRGAVLLTCTNLIELLRKIDAIVRDQKQPYGKLLGDIQALLLFQASQFMPIDYSSQSSEQRFPWGSPFGWC